MKKRSGWKKKSGKKRRISLSPLELEPLDTSASWLDEPRIAFAHGKTHFDPKVGIALYGPRSLGTARHKREVHVGFIGTGAGISRTAEFLAECAGGVDGDARHIPCAGSTLDRGFRQELRLDASLAEKITQAETKDILGIKDERQRFEGFLGLLRLKMRLLTQRDDPIDYVILVLPTALHERCRVADYFEPGVGRVHRDLRRAFKAMAMAFHKPTQILLETTMGVRPAGRSLDHKSVIAWNLLTGLYYKVGGLPWGPVGLEPASCYIGISFYRPLGASSTLRTSVVQAFDENGEGLVLRGHKFDWDESRQGRSPHLPEELAGSLVSMVFDRYRQERKQLPQRVVIHKTSRFDPDERAGLEKAVSSVDQFDLVAVTPTSHVRLLRPAQYPPHRGTIFKVGETSYLYTTGYLRSQGGFPHGHVPSPLQIADHIGDTPSDDLLREMLVLTKMNWNSANMDGLMPITLRFSRVVGDILREVPDQEEPEPNYAYYM